jgi:hypothetical protein
MNTFILRLKNSNDVVNKCTSDTLINAINYFASIKRLDSFSLLDIFDVVKIK